MISHFLKLHTLFFITSILAILIMIHYQKYIYIQYHIVIISIDPQLQFYSFNLIARYSSNIFITYDFLQLLQTKILTSYSLSHLQTGHSYFFLLQSNIHSKWNKCLHIDIVSQSLLKQIEHYSSLLSTKSTSCIVWSIYFFVYEFIFILLVVLFSIPLSKYVKYKNKEVKIAKSEHTQIINILKAINKDFYYWHSFACIL